MDYTKNALDYTQILTQLKRRGVLFKDESWIKCIVILRNSLAHHARVWNRRFPQMPQLSIKARGNWIDYTHIRPNKLYSQICCLAYLLDSIYPQNDFKTQIKILLNEYPKINIHHMGFPNDWESQALWI